MRAAIPLLLGSALLLSACGDSEQQAQGNSEQRRSGQQVATTPNPPATVPETRAQAPDTRSPETTATIPKAGAPAETTRSAVSLPGPGAASIAGRSFATNSGTLAFAADNSFTWRDGAGKSLSGRYVQEAERISFNDVQSGEGGASIPMTCRYRMDGPNRFIVEDSGTTCPVFRGLTFEAQG